MVNFVESLFGLAILSVLVAIVLRARGQRMPARWWALAAMLLGLLGLVLELYLRRSG